MGPTKCSNCLSEWYQGCSEDDIRGRNELHRIFRTAIKNGIRGEDPDMMASRLIQEATQDEKRTPMQPQWISVDDRLPEHEEEVLLYRPSRVLSYTTGWWNDDVVNNEPHFHVSYQYEFIPTHWMPLPEPPK